MTSKQRDPGLFEVLLLSLTGLLGWSALVWLTPVSQLREMFVSDIDFVTTLALALLSRLASFRIFQNVRVALDSVFYITAAFLVGVLPAAWLVLLVMTCDGVGAFLGQLVRGARPRGGVFRRLAQIAHDGSLPALVMLATGVLFDLDGKKPLRDFEVATLVPAFALVFLVLHYALAGSTHWAQGSSARLLVRGYFVRVVAAELALVPLSIGMVLGRMHQGYGLFVLLGGTCLIFSVLFRQAALTRATLHRRVGELATLNKVSRILSSSLERSQLMANIASETLALVRHASRFMIGTVDGSHDAVVYELFDEAGRNYKQLCADRDDGLSGFVMQHRRPLRLGNVQRDYALYSKSDSYRDPRFRSWLGVPLLIYDEVIGVISVQSEHPNAYSENHERVMQMIADQAAVALENSRLYELATVDGLTGLMVRRYFDQRVLEEWQRSARYGSTFSVGLLDIDNFKRLNDTYGHQAGDQVLRSVANVLRTNMRSFEIAARYGGEEFAMILPRTAVAEGVRVAQRIRGDVEQMFIPVGGDRLRVTVSIGLAGYPETSVDDVTQLINRADRALYQAKREGKNRVVVYGADGAAAVAAAKGEGAVAFVSGGAL